MRKIMHSILAGIALALSVLACQPTAIAQNTGNFYGTALASAARVATINSPDIVNNGYRGVHVVVRMSAFTSGTWTPSIEGKDPVSGVYYPILTGTAIAGVATQVLRVYPGITAAANAAASDFIPRTWRVVMTGASTPIGTFSVAYNAEQ